MEYVNNSEIIMLEVLLVNGITIKNECSVEEQTVSLNDGKKMEVKEWMK